jgi:hypothetical protein
LNDRNIDFAAACGAVLTNYCWNEAKALLSKEVALKNGLPVEKVYFGIDVWAQNTVDFGLPRTTYPQVKGGGTNTGVAVSKLAEMGLSAGVFGPAWSFEHFPSHGRDAERATWEGRDLWDGATCSCRGEASFCHPANTNQPITKSATQYPAGSERFFYTDFNRAFAAHEEEEAQRLYSGKKIHSQLGSQAPLPFLSPVHVYDGQILVDAVFSRLKVARRSRCADKVQSLLSVTGASYNPNSSTKDQIYERDLPLFKLDMPGDGSLQLYITCDYQAVASIYLKFSTGIKCVPIGETGMVPYRTIECAVTPDHGPYENVRLQELGVRITSRAFRKPIDLLEIYEIRIMPRPHVDLRPKYSIEHVQIERRGEGDTEHWRLRWKYLNVRGDDDRSALVTYETPYSDVTGPFSYFHVQIDGVDMGRAYALEHVLPKTFVESFGGEDVRVVLIGLGFDGEEIARFERESVLALL